MERATTAAVLSPPTQVNQNLGPQLHPNSPQNAPVFNQQPLVADPATLAAQFRARLIGTSPQKAPPPAFVPQQPQPHLPLQQFHQQMAHNPQHPIASPMLPPSSQPATPVYSPMSRQHVDQDLASLTAQLLGGPPQRKQYQNRTVVAGPHATLVKPHVPTPSPTQRGRQEPAKAPASKPSFRRKNTPRSTRPTP
eukprot:TRINITY_DN41476_c0_g1_i1.p2 TRINITY_DN41476_c0_g1~~TRINITY_DN41476_c0_g1_i1.p2  ORF type:complete len:194 (-),score=17.53 TRINITY_DN41476_c0_g1_i1:32-613(-)